MWPDGPAVCCSAARASSFSSWRASGPCSRPVPTTLVSCWTPARRSKTLLEACERFAEKDDRVSVQRREDLAYPGLTVHTFYVKYLLPISFDVHSQEPS